MIDDTRQYRPRLASACVRWCVGLSVACSTVLPAATAHAQSATDRAAAQALFDRAKKLMRAGKFAEACPALEESQRIEARSGTALNLASCYEHTDRLASAWSTFLDAATRAKAEGNSAREQGAREAAAALVPRLSNLVIRVAERSVPGLEITRDGQRVGSAQWGLPLPTDSGQHTVAASAPGRKPWETQVTVAGAASTTDVVVPELERDQASLSAAPAAGAGPRADSLSASPTEPQAEHVGRPVPGGVIASGVVTGVLAAGAIVTGVLYKSKNEQYETANNELADNRADLHSQTRALGVANLVLLGGTVVAAGVTVYLWVRRPSSAAAGSASIGLRGMVTPGLAGLSLEGQL